jgi:hypothetical protein
VKAYVATTGAIFGLLVVLHIWRVTQEPQLIRDPWYWLITLAAAALSLWAWWVVRTPSSRNP